MRRDLTPVLAWILFAALPLSGCAIVPARQAAQSGSPVGDAGATGTRVIHGYKNDLAGIRAANPNVTMRLDRDPALGAEPLLAVEYPAATKDPAGRDIQLETDTRDWTAARAIAFRIKSEHTTRFSVSFLDRNRVAYTAWTSVSAGAWQSVRLSFDEIRPNPYFQPPGAAMGAPLDVGDVRFIAFAPQDTSPGRFVVSQFVLVK